MIVYNENLMTFRRDVTMNLIADRILHRMKEENILGGLDNEFRSWQNSLNFMKNVLDDEEIPSDIDISIEYQIPRTSKRVDFIISGADKDNKDNVIVIELKQWERATKVDDVMQHSVRTFTGGAERIVNHPSYQAYAYSVFIKNSSEYVQNEDIRIIPCAYLHNYDPEYIKELNDDIFSIWYKEAPFFIRTQVLELRKFIRKYIARKSSDGKLLYKIDNGRIKPSKALQDCLVSMLKGNQEFLLLDEQAVCYDMCVRTMIQCMKDRRKRTIIIQGGPGTGKSVLAVNLLNEFIQRGYNASYVTKNSAPREAYQRLLSKSDLKKEVNIRQLFRSPFGLSNSPSDFYDCLIIDEAHRLVRQMYRDYNGTNQVMECINASLLNIFLIDEDQRITTKDIGSISEIEKYAVELNSRVIMNQDTILHSQFRCNGSDGYIQLLNDILEIDTSVKVNLEELNYEIRLFSDPNRLRDELRKKNMINNKARMVAGYCFDWNVKHHRGDYDVILENGFQAKWNLENDKIWAINPDSFEEIGCIHTAQGLEFDYVGVFIGNDLRYDEGKGHLIIDQSRISKDDNSSGIRNAPTPIAEKLIKNTYKTLLTRGQKGCYIYCQDKALLKHIANIVHKKIEE